MSDYTRAELIKLLADTHQALEAITDRHGCDMRVARILCEGENALKNPGIKAELAAATPAKAVIKGASRHVIH